jgi:hypothetical protein
MTMAGKVGDAWVPHEDVVLDEDDYLTLMQVEPQCAPPTIAKVLWRGQELHIPVREWGPMPDSAYIALDDLKLAVALRSA